ncbi:uncharacterized protein LOC117301718 [Asterias rubens]|uniref:uncharacterized protein LOC117301718 n=1 Tax=Asterias rubens TaxID=7604 RepID=UPI0014557956|nr:uncharacterized protein LOC117301718 [Asterias rubens]
MEVRTREKLCYHYDEIANELNTDHVLLCLSGSVLSEYECNKISASGTQQTKAKRLLDILCTKDALAYHHFRYALKERYPHLVRKLDEESVTPEQTTKESKATKITFKRRDSLILNLKTEGIVDILEHSGILTKDDCNMVKAGMTKEDKARVLVNLIPERGPTAYRQFKLAVRAQQPKLAELLE